MTTRWRVSNDNELVGGRRYVVDLEMLERWEGVRCPVGKEEIVIISLS
jgi:hypothetical protein